MILFPAIDLRDGVCVRLVRGDMESATVYNTDPAAQALTFEEQGFEWLHIVDLNGAVQGMPINLEAVQSILRVSNLPIQIGGGIRDMATIESWLDAGVRRVILGTAAARNPNFVIEAVRAFPDQIAVSIDAIDGRVALEGWLDVSETRVLDLALKMEDAGVCAIIFTDINRDGALTGVNIEATVDLAFQLQVPVIASGGVASVDDLIALKAVSLEAGIEGVISGRALYDGKINPSEALAVLRG